VNAFLRCGVGATGAVAVVACCAHARDVAKTQAEACRARTVEVEGQVKELVRREQAFRAEEAKSNGAKEELLAALRDTKLQLSRCAVCVVYWRQRRRLLFYRVPCARTLMFRSPV